MFSSSANLNLINFDLELDNETNLDEMESDLQHILFSRCAENKHDINILLTGKLSGGKTTFLNAMLGDLYSEAKIKKSTHGISFYILDNNCHQYKSQEEIFNINKQQNETEYDDELPFSYFHINKKLLSKDEKYYVNIIDTPGIDDQKIDKKTYEWMESNKNFIDICVIIIDIEQGLITKSNKTNMECLIKHCHSPIVFVVNKFDEDKDSELNELYTTCTLDITELMNKYKNKTYNICPASALNEYIYQMHYLNKVDKLSAREKSYNYQRTSNFDQFYKKINNIIDSIDMENNFKTKLLTFVKNDYKCETSIEDEFENIVSNEKTLDTFYTILHINKPAFSENELKIVTTAICDVLTECDLNINNFIKKYHEINTLYNITDKLKKLHIDMIFDNIDDITLEKIETIINDYEYDNDEKNIILSHFINMIITDIQNREEGDSTVLEDFDNLFSSNDKHYDTLVRIGKLINDNSTLNVLINTIDLYIYLIVMTNVNLETTSLKLSKNAEKCLVKKNKKGKTISIKSFYKLLLSIVKTKYIALFETYKNLNKLELIDGRVGISHIEFHPDLLIDIDFNNLHQYFEYLEIINKL